MLIELKFKDESADAIRNTVSSVNLDPYLWILFLVFLLILGGNYARTMVLLKIERARLLKTIDAFAKKIDDMYKTSGPSEENNSGNIIPFPAKKKPEKAGV